MNAFRAREMFSIDHLEHSQVDDRLQSERGDDGRAGGSVGSLLEHVERGSGRDEREIWAQKSTQQVCVGILGAVDANRPVTRARRRSRTVAAEMTVIAALNRPAVVATATD